MSNAPTSPITDPAGASDADFELPVGAVVETLVERHGEEARAAVRAGVERVAERWREDDGDAESFTTFCTERYVADADERVRLLDRLEAALEQVHGHLYEMRRSLRRWADLTGDVMPGVDELLATFDPAPDLSEEVYRQKLAFLALLNFDRPDLATMLADGADWSAREWASARIAQAFGPRIPKDVADLARELGFRANQWVANFHVPVGTMVDAGGARWFEADRRLLAHWLIREEMKAGYGDEKGLAKQRALAWVMARHIDGSIPTAVMSGDSTEDWDPAANTVGGAPAGETVGLDRYERWLDQYTVARALDEHHPDHPSAIARKFELQREIPELEVEAMLVELLSHPVRRDLAALLRDRLGRPLEAHDVYFDDVFESRPAEELNDAVRAMFADEKAFQARLPEVLRGLGFSEGDATFLGSHVRVEIAKGSGHAMRPALPQYGAWLRTNRLKDQLGWDGFDTAMHELGHNLEQLCSTYFVPRPALRGVPNTACTEAFAFLYQSLAKRVLGLENADEAERAYHEETIASILMSCQIAGPALVELRAWRWLYETGPSATAEGLREAVLANAESVWNEFFRADFGEDPYRILAAYQHMVAHPLYLADYALGRMIGHQIRSHVRGRDLATETKRITSIGRLTPEAWMRVAVGSGLSPAVLCEDAATAVNVLR